MRAWAPAKPCNNMQAPALRWRTSKAMSKKQIAMLSRTRGSIINHYINAIQRLYIDSRHRVNGTVKDFDYQLNTNVTVAEESLAVCWTQCVFPNCWYTVSKQKMAGSTPGGKDDHRSLSHNDYTTGILRCELLGNGGCHCLDTKQHCAQCIYVCLRHSTRALRNQ